MYLELVSEEDKKMTDNWTADADGILIFVRLYLLFGASHRLNPHRPDYSLLPSHP